MTYWRAKSIEGALGQIKTFTPSTTENEGNLIEKEPFVVWNAIVKKQQADWDRIEKLLRPLKLGKKELGYLWYWCATTYNWRGWSTTWGLTMKIAAQEMKA